MTANKLIKDYNNLHEDIKQHFTLYEYMKTYASVEEFKEFNELGEEAYLNSYVEEV